MGIDLEALRERVRRGAALLDEHRPGWATLVAADRLAMHRCDACILGQVYGDYAEGWWVLTGALDSRERFRGSAFGFTLEESVQRDAYRSAPIESFLKDELGESVLAALFAPLAEMWREEILARVGRPRSDRHD